MIAFLKYIGKWPPLMIFAGLCLLALPLVEKVYPAVVADAITPVPLQVITVGGVLTEFVYALWAGDRPAAVGTTSTYPAATLKLPQAGYQRSLSAEGVLAQNRI